jgi:hypothetical protein
MSEYTNRATYLLIDLWIYSKISGAQIEVTPLILNQTIFKINSILEKMLFKTLSIMTFEHDDTQYNDTDLDKTQHNDIEPDDTQYNDNDHDDTQHKDIEHDDTQYSDIVLEKIKHNVIEHDDTQHDDSSQNNYI